MNAKREPPFLKGLREEIGRNPAAVEMSYPERLDPKIAKLLEYFPNPGMELAPFFAAILFHVTIKVSHLENSLKFLNKVDVEKRIKVAGLISFLWPRRDEPTEQVGLSGSKSARAEAMTVTLGRIDHLRKYIKAAPETGWDAKALKKVGKVLRMDAETVLEIVSIRPRILRGLWKPPRPIYAWIGPFLLACVITGWTVLLVPGLSLVAVYLLFMAVVISGVWIVSTRLAIAPGVLCYEKTRRRLGEICGEGWKPSGAVAAMAELGIDTEEYARSRQYDMAEQGIRIEICDKRRLEDAMQFLTSSENIGNCIALRNFVAWCLPSLLDDETIMLADVSYRGSTKSWHQRAQLWMVAAEQEGRPVLTVNSIEFNNEGAKYLDILMPEIVQVMEDVARRCGFEAIYVGISDFGRDWMDNYYEQGTNTSPIRKVHSPELGFRYYFDAYAVKRNGGKHWEYLQQRGWFARSYAIVFGVLELQKGNRAKAREFFRSAWNVNNFWEIPVVESGVGCQESGGTGERKGDLNE